MKPMREIACAVIDPREAIVPARSTLWRDTVSALDGCSGSAPGRGFCSSDWFTRRPAGSGRAREAHASCRRGSIRSEAQGAARAHVDICPKPQLELYERPE